MVKTMNMQYEDIEVLLCARTNQWHEKEYVFFSDCPCETCSGRTYSAGQSEQFLCAEHEHAIRRELPDLDESSRKSLAENIVRTERWNDSSTSIEIDRRTGCSCAHCSSDEKDAMNVGRKYFIFHDLRAELPDLDVTIAKKVAFHMSERQKRLELERGRFDEQTAKEKNDTYGFPFNTNAELTSARVRTWASVLAQELPTLDPDTCEAFARALLDYRKRVARKIAFESESEKENVPEQTFIVNCRCCMCVEHFMPGDYDWPDTYKDSRGRYEHNLREKCPSLGVPAILDIANALDTRRKIILESKDRSRLGRYDDIDTFPFDIAARMPSSPSLRTPLSNSRSLDVESASGERTSQRFIPENSHRARPLWSNIKWEFLVIALLALVAITCSISAAIDRAGYLNLARDLERSKITQKVECFPRELWKELANNLTAHISTKQDTAGPEYDDGAFIDS